MADVKFIVSTDSSKALNDFAKLTTAQQKMDLETKKLNSSLTKLNTNIDKTGKASAKAASSGSAPSITPYIPGGGLAEQLKQGLGALGITGFAGAALGLVRALDANTQAVLDRAKEQRELSRKVGPSEFFQNKDPRFQGEYGNFRNRIAQQTATPLEDIDKLNTSFSAIVTSAEDLNNIITSIAIASKLNLASMDELIALEQKNIANGGVAGNAVSDLTKLNTITNGAAQVKTLLDEIGQFKNQNTGFALGASLVKTDAANAEENLKLLAAFQEKGSNTNLRSYMRVGNDVEGDEFLNKFTEFVSEKSGKLGMSKDSVIDAIVKQGDLDAATGDAFKTMMKDVDSLSGYINEFSSNASSSKTALEGMIDTLNKLKDSNLSFKQSFYEDQSKVEKEIKNSSTKGTVETDAFQKQMELNQVAINKNMANVLSKDENGMVKDNMWNRILLADEKVPFIEGPAEWREGAKKRLEENYLKSGKGELGFLDAAELVKDEIGMGLTKPAEMISKQLEKAPWLKEMLSVGADDIPILGGLFTYGKTGKILPGYYKQENANGEVEERFSLGGLGQLAVDLGTWGAGGFIGKKLGIGAGTKAVNQSTKTLLKSELDNQYAKFAEETFKRTGVKSIIPKNQQLVPNELAKQFSNTAQKEVEALEKALQPADGTAYKLFDNVKNKHIIDRTIIGSLAGGGSSHIINEGFPTQGPFESNTERMVRESYSNGSRDVIDVYSPKEDLQSVDGGIKQLSMKVEDLVNINKSLLQLQAEQLEAQKKIKDNTFNAAQKPFYRNQVK